MPLFTNSDLRADPFHKTDKWRAGVGLGDYLGAVAEDAWEGLPSVGLVRLGQVAAGQVKAAGMNLELDENSMPIIKPGESQMSILPEEEQKKLIESAGLTGQVKPQPGYGRETLQLIMDRKQAELARRTTREDASALFAPLGFATELAMGLVDPINVASAFVPVVSEARALRLLARQSSAAGRAGVRAGIGAVEGAVGALALEPITWLSQTRQQLDYDMSDSLLNVAFGAAFGAALQPATGAVGDYLRARRGQRQPWQIVADNDASRALMQSHMERIRDARIASGTEERRAAEEAQAAAALFDARARTWAYDFNRPVAEYYDRFMPNYRAMDAAKLGDTEARLAEEMGVIASSQVQPAQKRKRRKAGQSVTVQVPEEVQFSGENVWRPANRPQYTEEQLAARRARSTLPEDDAANWLETPRGRYGIRYEVWELADLLPSNDPFNQFQRMADYPSTAQERAYHRVPAEQEKVRRNAAILNPRYLVSDSPDASSGPPVVTTDGVVLGGNSRTMSMQLAFTKPEKLREYKDYLAARSQNYGIDPASFSGMQAPVLVRVLQGDMNPDEMSIASNAFNQVATEELDVVAEGVSKSRRIDNRILTEIGSALENFDTLREYMGNRESRDLVQMLIEKEIIAPNQVGRMVNAKTGLLTSTGKDLLESALRGLIIQDYDILANASENVASVLRKIDRAILPLVRLKKAGGKWDLPKIVTKALQQLYRADASMPEFRLSDLPGYFSSGDLGGVDPDKALRAVQAVALTLANSQTSVREAAARFNVMASIAEQEHASTSMGSLVPRKPVTPEQAFIQAFLSTVATMDNKPVLNFRPATNTSHAAIQWADEHASSLPDALGKLEKLATDETLSADERNMYKEYYRKLADLGAEKVAVYQPKVGEFFSYNPDADRLGLAVNYEQTPMSDTAHASLERDVHNFGVEVDKIVKAGQKPSSPVRMLSQTPLVMQLVGRDALSGKVAASGGIYAAPHVFDGSHPNITPEMLKQVPAAMADPIAVFDSATHKSSGDLVFMLELVDENGATVVVPVALQSKGDRETIEINIAKTIYAKTDFNNENKPYNKWFREQFENKKARYVNGQKIKRWQDSAGVYFPFTPLLNASGNKVYTETDLVNIRTQNPALYQTAYHGSPFRFDSFSTEHIGEGEGAQVHGWGLYFTKNKKIGEKYRKALKQRSEHGQLFSVDIPENNVLLDEQKTFSKQNKNVKDLLYKAIESFSSNEEDRFYEKLLEEKFDDNTELENARKELDRLSTQQKSFLIAMSPKGPAFLASRANLKSQGFSDEQIQQFINNPEMGIEEAKKLTPVVRAVQEKVDALATQDRERRAAIIQEAKEDFGKTLENVTGRKLYAAIAYALSDNSYKYESKEASLWLNKHGIKGITYMGDTDGRCFVVFDDKAVEVLRTFYQGQDTSAPRARVIFDDAAASKAVIEFFSSADASSAPHELYHVFRREMAESAARPDAPQRVRDDWARIEAFVGAQPSQAWTREMEEKFAKAGERYLLEGVAPSPALTGVFERLKQWFLELYANADAAGLNISPAMREVFGRMFSTPAEQGDKAFRYALGDLLSRRVDPVEEPLTDEVSASTAENIEEYMAMAADDLNRSLTDLDALDPQASSQIRAEYIEGETALNTEIEHKQLETSVMVEAARCDVRYN